MRQAENHQIVNEPNRVFDAMTPAEQDEAFTKAGAAAIRDGADISQVVAARDGMSYGGISKVRVNDEGRTVNERHRSVIDDRTTTAGTTRRGFYGSQTEAGRARQARLTPQEIYRQAGTNRELAVDLLERYGYIIG